MSSITEKIGIFPLGLVMFPGSFLQLHIFEERYKELINFSLNQNSYFGINLVDSSRLHNVGCTARVVEVLNRYDDGRLDIVVAGGRRYVLNQVFEQEKAYYTANVEYFDDNNIGEIDANLFDECVEMYNKIIEVVFHGDGELTLQHSPAGEANLSFLMAQKAGLSLEQKQELLEMRDENQRLTFLHRHMKEILPKIQQAEHIQRVVMSDGYFVPTK